MFSTDCYVLIGPNSTPWSRGYSLRILWIGDDGYGIHYVVSKSVRYLANLHFMFSNIG